MNAYPPRLGIDIGHVIVAGPRNRNEDTGFFDGDEAALLATPEMPGAFEAIGRLVLLFEAEVWLISKCGPRIQERTLRWLDGHNFWRDALMLPRCARFCRRRPEKRDICLELGVTHFVDDRADVLQAMSDVVPNRYLFGPQQQAAPAGITAVLDWAAAERAIRIDYPLSFNTHHEKESRS